VNFERGKYWEMLKLVVTFYLVLLQLQFHEITSMAGAIYAYCLYTVLESGGVQGDGAPLLF